MLHWPQYPHSSSPQGYLSHFLLWRTELLSDHWCSLARSRKMGFFRNSASINIYFLKEQNPISTAFRIEHAPRPFVRHSEHIRSSHWMSLISVISRRDPEPKLSFSQMIHCVLLKKIHKFYIFTPTLSHYITVYTITYLLIYWQHLK